MARIAGVDIPRDKRTVISLTYIYGIGATMASHVCEATKIDENTRVRDLTDEETARLRGYVEGELRVEGAQRTVGIYVHYDGQPVDPSSRRKEEGCVA